MEKKTIGQFIAALRKANGLTQQEVADRLAVSNKAVSRWERDECAPDIAVIPALAELLGVTCDELLKGERITNDSQGNREVKVEKQLKNYINKSITKYKNMFLIAMGIGGFGFICIFSFTYPIIMLIEMAAIILTLIAVNQMRAEKDNNELFEKLERADVERFDRCLGRYSFVAFLLSIEAVVLTFVRNDVVLDLLMSFIPLYNEAGLLLLVGLLVPLVGIVVIRKPYEAWITGREYQKEKKAILPSVQRINFLRTMTLAGSYILFLVSPEFDYWEVEIAPLYYVVRGIAYAILVGGAIATIVAWIRGKDIREEMTLPAIRNVLMMIPALMFAYMTVVEYRVIVGDYKNGKHIAGHPEAFWIAIMGIVIVWFVFWIVEKIREKRKRA